MKMINKIYSILFIFVLLLTLTSFATASGSGVYTYWLDENNTVMTSTLKEVTQGDSVIFEWNSYAMNDPVHTIVKIVDVNTGLLVSAADLGFANPIYDADHTTQITGATTIDTSNLIGEFWVVIQSNENGFFDDMILTLVVNENVIPNDAPVWQTLDDDTVMLETETYTLSNLQQYVTDEDLNSLQFSVATSVSVTLGGDETGADCFIQDNKNLVCSFDEIGTTEIILTVEDNAGQTDSTSFNLIVEDKLDLVTMNCGDDVVLDEMLKCTAYVTNGIGQPAEEANVYFSLPNDATTLKVSCKTNDKGYCNVGFLIENDFTINTYYNVDAFATLANHYDSDIVTETFLVWERGYAILEAKIYNDPEFSIEYYDFFRGEALYTKFKIADMEGNILINEDLIKRVYLVVNNGEELDFAEWDNLTKTELDNKDKEQSFWAKLFGAKDDYYYYYVDSIPLTDDFLGEGHVFWFVFDFEDNIAGQTQAAVRISNNPLTFDGISNIELQKNENGFVESYTIDLKDYVYDLETSDEEMLFTFVEDEETTVIDLGNNVFEINMARYSEGSHNLRITADDTDGSTETQNIVITILEYEEEYQKVNAKITYDDTLIYYVGDTVNFDGYASTGSDGTYATINKCVWNVDDVDYLPINVIENTASKRPPLACDFSKTFDEPGMYQVSLTVEDLYISEDSTLFDTDVIYLRIFVEDVPEGPVAIINAESRTPVIRPTLLDGSESYAEEGTVLVSYEWTILDANNTLVAQLNGEEVIYSFTETQSYTVELTVTDNEGRSDTAEKVVEVYSTSIYGTQVEEDESAHSGLALLSCEVFGTTSKGVAAGEDVEIQVILKNYADYDLEDLRMSFVIPEFGTKFTSGPLDLDEGEKDTLIIHGFLPYDIEPGIYYPLYIVSNDEGVRRVKSGFMEVVNG